MGKKPLWGTELQHLRSVYQDVMVTILLTRASLMALITALMDWEYPVTAESMEVGKPRQDMITSCPLKWAFRLFAEKMSASTTWKQQTGNSSKWTAFDFKQSSVWEMKWLKSIMAQVRTVSYKDLFVTSSRTTAGSFWKMYISDMDDFSVFIIYFCNGSKLQPSRPMKRPSHLHQVTLTQAAPCSQSLQGFPLLEQMLWSLEELGAV